MDERGEDATVNAVPSTRTPAAQEVPAPRVAQHPAETVRPKNMRTLVHERVKATNGHNSAANMRAREAAKQNKRKVRDLNKLAADKCGSGPLSLP